MASVAEVSPAPAPTNDAPSGASLPALPWPDLYKIAAVGTLLCMVAVFAHLARFEHHPANLVYPGTEGAANELIAEDFPAYEVPGGLGHDGQYFYAIARHLPNLNAAGEHLDRPQYRLQRPLLPAVARVAALGSDDPDALVRGFWIAGALAVFVGTLSAAALSVTLGNHPLWGLLFSLAPGVFWSVHIAVADAYAVAFTLAAITLSLRSRHGLAVGAAVLMVLSKEPLWLVLFGFCAWRRDRPAAVLAVIPAGVAVFWAGLLRLVVEDNSEGVVEFTLPGGGLSKVVGDWFAGEELAASLSIGAAFLLSAVFLMRKGLQHPFSIAVVLNALFLLVLDEHVIGVKLNATRMAMPLLALTIFGLLDRTDWSNWRQNQRRGEPAPSANPAPTPVS